MCEETYVHLFRGTSFDGERQFETDGPTFGPYLTVQINGGGASIWMYCPGWEVIEQLHRTENGGIFYDGVYYHDMTVYGGQPEDELVEFCQDKAEEPKTLLEENEQLFPFCSNATEAL